MKYALIGCGRIAVNHMKAAINNKLEIVAVCDVLPEKMEALLAKYDLQNDASIKSKICFFLSALFLSVKFTSASSTFAYADLAGFKVPEES